MANTLLRRRVRERSAGEDVTAFVSGLLFGGIVAAGAAILFAPSDGATFRERLSRRVNELLGTGPDDESPLETFTSKADSAAVSDGSVTSVMPSPGLSA